MFPRNFSQKLLSLDICVYISESPGDGQNFRKFRVRSEHGFVNKEKDLQTTKPSANRLSTKLELCTIIKKQY